MISFPEMLPDELFYSCCSRYHNESGNETTSQTMKELFGNTGLKITCMFPSHLDNFVKRYNSKWGRISNHDILMNHTNYPLFRLFLGREQSEMILKMIGGNLKFRPHFILGIKNNLWEQELSFCSDCVKEDDLIYGFPYWHRLHQAPGVLFCPRHCKRLKKSCPKCSFKFEVKNNFLGIKRFCRCGHDFSRDMANQVASIHEYSAQKELLSISQDIAYIISGNFNTGHQWQQLYREYISKTNYCSLTGRLNQRALANDFISFFSKPTLKILECELSNINWIQHFFNSKQNVYHPIKHMLFIRFLFGSISNFYNDVREAA
ncbi:TnsD family Tn7-like transposition protein [Paenibacillus sp. P36]|uniref:TnsD family Tn7-like transposition protein n=1 Tax=Paenibacillus sp. P36 TaxID=3342538 RepID=UPI0038B2B10C